jgi:hypothetical protein
MPFSALKHKGLIFDATSDANFTGNGIHCYGGLEYFVACFPTGANGALEAYEIGQKVGLYSSNDNGTLYSECVLDKGSLAIIANNATLSNVTVWGSDSILTQGRGDGRYATPSCLTYTNLTGTPPIATNTTLGAIKVGTTLEIANGVLDVTVLTIDGGSATASGPNVYDGGGA